MFYIVLEIEGYMGHGVSDPELTCTRVNTKIQNIVNKLKISVFL